MTDHSLDPTPASLADQIKELRGLGVRQADLKAVAARLGLKRTTFYRWAELGRSFAPEQTAVAREIEDELVELLKATATGNGADAAVGADEASAADNGADTAAAAGNGADADTEATEAAASNGAERDAAAGKADDKADADTDKAAADTGDDASDDAEAVDDAAEFAASQQKAYAGEAGSFAQLRAKVDQLQVGDLDQARRLIKAAVWCADVDDLDRQDLLDTVKKRLKSGAKIETLREIWARAAADAAMAQAPSSDEQARRDAEAAAAQAAEKAKETARLWVDAEPLARCPDILADAVETAHLAGVVGEDEAIAAHYLAATSRVLAEDRVLSTCGTGQSSTGKSHVARWRKSLVVSGDRPQGLAYVPELSKKPFMARHWISNPTGRGGFGDRPGDIWSLRIVRGEVESCTATSKRSGQRCRFSAMRGKTVCFWHGGKAGRGNFARPTSKRHLRNIEIKRARVAAEAEVIRRQVFAPRHPEAIHPDAYADLKVYIAGGKLRPADEARLLLQLDALHHGELTAATWREVKRSLGLSPQRPPPSSVLVCEAVESELTMTTVIGKGPRGGW